MSDISDTQAYIPQSLAKSRSGLFGTYVDGRHPSATATGPWRRQGFRPREQALFPVSRESENRSAPRSHRAARFVAGGRALVLGRGVAGACVSGGKLPRVRAARHRTGHCVCACRWSTRRCRNALPAARGLALQRYFDSPQRATTAQSQDSRHRASSGPPRHKRRPPLGGFAPKPQGLSLHGRHRPHRHRHKHQSRGKHASHRNSPSTKDREPCPLSADSV